MSWNEIKWHKMEWVTGIAQKEIIATRHISLGAVHIRGFFSYFFFRQNANGVYNRTEVFKDTGSSYSCDCIAKKIILTNMQLIIETEYYSQLNHFIALVGGLDNLEVI